MEKISKSGFYVIDVLSLKQPAGKPFHLEERLKAQGRSRLRVNTTSAAGAGGIPSPTSPSSVSFHSHDRSNRDSIEARRSRLAKRHSHVQEVMSAHRRQSGSENVEGRIKIEDNLAAAERKRADLKDRQTKAVAAKNAKVKEVHDNALRKEQEQAAAQRRLLEDRLKSSELRRRQIALIPRSKLLQLNDILLHNTELISIQEAAALKIQRWWRAASVAQLLRLWKKSGLTVEKATEKSFDDLVKLVQSKSVIRSIAAVLAQFKKVLSKLDESSAPWKNPSRVFLSAFIIVAHPAAIIPDAKEEEEKLKADASEMLSKFEAWVDSQGFQTENRPVTILLEAVKSWASYYASFEEWKERDTRKIIDGLISHWLELEKLWLSVREQMDADVQWGPKIDEQQKVIIARLRRFGDSALASLKEKRKKLHEEFGLMEEESEDDDAMHTVDGLSRFSMSDNRAETPTDDEGSSTSGSASRSVSPAMRRTSASDLLSTSPKRFPSSMSVSSSDSVSPLNSGPATPSRGISPLRRNERRTPSPLVAKSRVLGESPRLSTQSLAGRLSSTTMDIASMFGSPMSNEQLAHELTLDPDFALKKPELSALETQVRDSVRKIFFDDVRSSFARGEYLPHLIDFITDIRKQLLSMVSEKGKIAADLVEFMDVEFIHQKIVTKTLDLKGLLSFVITKMSQLCAPIRDQAVRDLNASLNAVAGSADFVGVIEGILGLLDDMKLDLANFRLQSLKPHLKDVAVEYERGHFKTALESGSVTLDRTKEWLSRSVRLQEEVARARNPEGIAIPENRVRYTDAFHDAILGLVFGWNGSAVVKDSAAGEASTSAPDTDGALPETLVMDAVRLNKFQNEAQKLVIIAALIMLSQNIVTEIRGDKAFVIGLKENLLALLNDPEGLTLDNLSLQVVAKISEILLQRRNKQLGEDKVALIKTMVEKTMSTKDPVFNLVRRRVMAAIKAHIVTGTFKREGLDRAGLEPVRTELESFSYKVSVWVRFNGEVYTEYYDSILKELI